MTCARFIDGESDLYILHNHHSINTHTNKHRHTHTYALRFSSGKRFDGLAGTGIRGVLCRIILLLAGKNLHRQFQLTGKLVPLSVRSALEINDVRIWGKPG